MKKETFLFNIELNIEGLKACPNEPLISTNPCRISKSSSTGLVLTSIHPPEMIKSIPPCLVHETGFKPVLFYLKSGSRNNSFGSTETKPFSGADTKSTPC